ncbi:FAD-dependent oxidoreductase [Roseomonas sp. SSH11]|uniref:FAD-dependent oxidoreductase n=1 Tax=Pararoseomonas baculiformis TaxID=2820812 RepID=A0ABS4AB16_9PROT|nr:FAD-dependent oxidoreductase [Pararoseomonas baculiformis]MBP0444195.1 FAD-dependent oxidoreductase [Pararoseomonas baculiformis]
MGSGRVIILGAGVAGLSTALPLLRAGREVTVIDPLGPAGGASFGNAGLLSADTVVPIALPGMLRKVPGWLSDPLGPLVVRPAYLPRAAPWLARWIRAGRMDRVHAISDAMRALHAPAFDDWRELLGAEGYSEFIRRTGQVQIWDEPEETPGAALERGLRERLGIQAEVLGADEIRQFFPGIARHVSRGVLVPGNGHTVSPPRVVRRLGELFLAGGGTILPERAMKLIPQEGGGWMVMTNTGNHRAGQVVVAGGAWSRLLLDPLGIRVPLETERGYHLMLPDPSITPKLPILYKSGNFGVTPMEEGLRVAGTVEIAGLDAAPDERRAQQLLRQLRGLFPDIQGGEARLWMGYRPSTPDSLPVLGPVPSHPGLHLCFGHGHFGMTGAPPSGRLVAGTILGDTPRIDMAPYSITRFH